MKQPRLVLTERTESGMSVAAQDAPIDAISIAAVPGAEVFLAWGTEDGGASVGVGSRAPTRFPVYPGAGGTRAMFVRLSPAAETTAPDGDPEELFAEAERKLPGMLAAFEPDASGMHTTDSIDYGICLEGELTLELDDGQTVQVTPGTCVVQQGTRHAWRNDGDVPALMCFVIVGAEREQ